MKHLLKLADLSARDIMSILNLADQMKFILTHQLDKRPLSNKTLAMLHSDCSVWTRLSFETGAYQLGGHVLSISEKEYARIGPAEKAAMLLSGYVDGIMLCAMAQDEAERFAAHSSVPVMSAGSESANPLAALAILMSAMEKHAVLQNVSLCIVGGGELCHSLAVASIKCGMRVTLSLPQGVTPLDELLQLFDEGLIGPVDDVPESADVVFYDLAALGAGPRRTPAEAGRSAVVLCGIMEEDIPSLDLDTIRLYRNEIDALTSNLLHVQKAVMVMLLGSDNE